MNRRGADFAAWIMLGTMASCLWGLAAYLRMPIELLPASRDRVAVISVEAPGHTASELAERTAAWMTPLFRRQGFRCEVVSRYHSHGFAATCRTPGVPDLALHLGALKRAVVESLDESGLKGARVELLDEPLADRLSLRVAVRADLTQSLLESLAQGLRGLPPVATVTVRNEISAWNDAGEFLVLDVARKEHAGPVETSASVRKLLASFPFPKQALRTSGSGKGGGPGTGAFVFRDEAEYIRASESNLFENIISGTLLTVLCVFLFLRAFGSTVLVGLSIPLCVLLSVPFLHAMGVTRNIMSLAGMALSVGIVVDASLSIVSEFDERMATKRYTPSQAAFRTVAEAFSPLLVATLSTLAVFVPILFLGGRVGELFSELSKAVIVSNLVSLFVSLVVLPSLLTMSRWSASKETPPGPAEPASSMAPKHAPAAAGMLPAFPVHLGLWRRALFLSAGSPLRSAAFLVASFGSVWMALATLPSREFLPPPREGQGFVELARLSTAEAHPAEPVDRRDASILQALLRSSGARRILIHRDAGKILGFFDPAEVDLPRLRSRLADEFPLRSPFAALENPLRPSSSQRQDVVFFYRADPAGRARLENWLRGHPGVEYVSLSSGDVERVVIHPWVLPPESAIQPRATERRFLDGLLGLRGDAAYRREPRALVFLDGTIYDEGDVKLSAGETTLRFEAGLREFAEKGGIALRRGPGSREAEESLEGLGKCLLLAVGIIFVILYAQNRSLSKSSVILATFAWAPLGAVPALSFHGETLNGSALVGFILLAGTIVNNGILLMDRIEKNLQAQMSTFEASLAGVRERFLNVVVTGLTTILAMLPMIWGDQEGAQMYRSLSIVVVYGTVASTPVSFLGIPALLVFREWVGEVLARMRLRWRVGHLSPRLRPLNATRGDTQ